MDNTPQSISKNADWLSSPLYVNLANLIYDCQTSKQLEEGFYEVAKILLQQSKLKVSGRQYQFIDIEFYFYHESIHPDPYSHSFQYAKSVRNKQSVIGSWYFHRFTRVERYTHTRRGLDLTYGNGEKGKYGGILIRGIKDMEDGRLIQGPSRVVGEIMSVIENLVQLERVAFDMSAGLAFNSNEAIHISLMESPLPLLIRSSERFGLSDKAPKYREKKYRFRSFSVPT